MPEDNKKDEIKSLVLEKEKERERDDKNKDETLKDKIKDKFDYVDDKFNFWIYVGFTILGVLLILSLILLIYMIFSNKPVVPIEPVQVIKAPVIVPAKSSWFSSSVANESIPLPKKFEPVIEKTPTNTSSWFSSSPVETKVVPETSSSSIETKIIPETVPLLSKSNETITKKIHIY